MSYERNGRVPLGPSPANDQTAREGLEGRQGQRQTRREAGPRDHLGRGQGGNASVGQLPA